MSEDFKLSSATPAASLGSASADSSTPQGRVEAYSPAFTTGDEIAARVQAYSAEDADKIRGLDRQLRMVADIATARGDEGWQEVQRLEARIKELEANMTWQSIESAPRDGTHILLWAQDLGAFEGYWEPGEYSPVLGRNDDRWASPQGHDFYPHLITHWMPLPPSPKEGSNG